MMRRFLLGLTLAAGLPPAAVWHAMQSAAMAR